MSMAATRNPCGVGVRRGRDSAEAGVAGIFDFRFSSADGVARRLRVRTGALVDFRGLPDWPRFIRFFAMGLIMIRSLSKVH